MFVFPGPWPFAWPLALAPNLCLPVLAPNWYLPYLTPNLYLPALDPNMYVPALVYNFITSPGPEFAYTKLVSSTCICIYHPTWPTICITGPEPEFAFTLLLVVVTVVVVTAVVVISLEQIIPIFVCQF